MSGDGRGPIGWWRRLRGREPIGPPPWPSGRRRLAVLIDGDNVTHQVLAPLFRELVLHGSPTLRRIYGDWSSPQFTRWKPHLDQHAIQPVHQCRHVAGKNSSDVALVIDAMDLLHTHRADGFCLVTSDSDFTRLAIRIREEGLLVIGCGSRHAAPAWRAACDHFLPIEGLIATSTPTRSPGRPRSLQEPPVAPPPSGEPAANGSYLELADRLLRAFDEVRSPADEEVSLSDLGAAIHRADPGFDPRVYGHRRFSHLVQATGLFELRTRPSQEPGPGSSPRVRRRETGVPHEPK